MNKKFCPSCGGATLLRTSVSVTAPKDGSEPKLKVHLKKNFQYRNRGTIYSIPAPKAGTSKTGPGEGLILRADQTAWLRAEKKDESRKRKEEKHMAQSMKNAEAGEAWKDPDWMPEMLTVGMSGKGRTGPNGMPAIGYGRKNPNERRRRK
jgi:RNA-binding protein NOB1